LAKSVTLNILGNDEVKVVLLPDLIDCQNARMIEGRSGARLLLEPPHPILVADEVRRKELESDRATQLCVPGQIDVPHSACSEGTDDAVVGE
jgi:hypothetical protein